MNLHDLFAIPRLRTPSKSALEFRTGPSAAPRTYSYEALFAAAERLAAGLQARGLQKGERVAFFAGNSPQYVIAWLAVVRFGAVMVPMNTRYRRSELEHILGDCTPRFIITDASLLPLLVDAASGAVHDWLPKSVDKILLTEALHEIEMESAALHLPIVDGDDLAVIMYTSGTTGPSKGAMLTHNMLLATVTALLAAWDWQPSDRLLLVLPLFHVHGLVVGLHCALAAGATTLLRQAFDAHFTTIELLTGSATCFFAVPTIYVRLLDALAARSRAEIKALSAMRLFCSGSAPLAPETFEAFRVCTGHTILERYGMTETGMNLSNPYAGPRVAGSVGLPLPGVSSRVVRARDDATGREDVDMGEVGELLIAGANVFAGYWNAPEKSANAFETDGAGRHWFRTGDLARQDPESGYFSLLGRMHDLIISGGFNIYPREIEELLVRYPGIRDAAVVGVADGVWGEHPEAWIVCTEIPNTNDLDAWCRAHMASFKAPHAFHVVDGLPRNAMGKVLKHLLR